MAKHRDYQKVGLKEVYTTPKGNRFILTQGNAPEEVIKAAKEMGIDYLGNEQMVCAWNKVIWCKQDHISKATLAHEMVHIDQQAEYGNASSYLYEYVHNPEFRLKVEIEAYATELHHIYGKQRASMYLLQPHFTQVIDQLMNLYKIPFLWPDDKDNLKRRLLLAITTKFNVK